MHVPQNWVCSIAVASVCAGLVGPPLLADHIRKHEECDPTFPMPIPGEEFFDGGAMIVDLIGPIEDAVITNTTFDITYVSDGATPASELLLHGSVQVDREFVEFTVTGADLGFGSGEGTFHGKLQTDDLNGLVWPNFLFAPHSIVSLQVGAINGGIEGTAYFVDSFITFDVIPPPPCPPACPEDLDGSGTVDFGDILIVLAAWGACE